MTPPKLPDEPTPRTDALVKYWNKQNPIICSSMVLGLTRQLERELTSALALAAEREVEIEKWKSLYNGACNDLGASLEQHEATKQRAEAANARAIRSKHEKGS